MDFTFFLNVNSKWADHIVIVDQYSTDKTAEIVKKHPKVIYVLNENQQFDEHYRQKLYENARQIQAAKRIFIALDADEFIPEVKNCDEWDKIKKLDAGTTIKFRWINFIPGSKKWWQVPEETSFGYK